jgi:Glycosyl hydrolase 2 galactose-binding domain-like/Exo-beta-D-glucosaminidase Ig-fold domain/Concanavalin A-like lectin/glucanases superfamily/Glycosyl hydrolases family 2
VDGIPDEEYSTGLHLASRKGRGSKPQAEQSGLHQPGVRIDHDARAAKRFSDGTACLCSLSSKGIPRFFTIPEPSREETSWPGETLLAESFVRFGHRPRYQRGFRFQFRDRCSRQMGCHAEHTGCYAIACNIKEIGRHFDLPILELHEMRQTSIANRTFLLLCCALFSLGTARAQSVLSHSPYGPYNGIFLPGGSGLSKAGDPADAVFQAMSPWSLYCWFQSQTSHGNKSGFVSTLLAGAGDPREEYSRYFGIREGKPVFWMGKDNSLTAPAGLPAGEWHFLAATFDGVRVHFYSDGQQVASGRLALGRVSPEIEMAPEQLPWEGAQHFGGRIAALTLLPTALGAEEVHRLAAQPPNASLIVFEEGSKPWPVQTRAQAGYRAPQDPASLPRSAALFSPPVARPLPPSGPSLQPRGASEWAIAGDWKLTPAPKVHSDGAAISRADFDTKDWWPATVPGTVLTTMVDRGLYPDPDHGLNNLAIPELLNKQDYWYRAEFATPKAGNDRHFTLTLNGINYAAAVWLNGQHLGDVEGAFIRGTFDVTNLLMPGYANALAVRISPPPHPGIPHEQSIKAGPGENGGIMVLDGPTFMATEGWDWIPAIRDRNTGIWQDVVLSATGQVRIGDPRVVTTLPLPDISRADVEIEIPLINLSDTAVEGVVSASFEQTTVTKRVILAPGETTVELKPAEFPQLTVQNPRLWWPNGYGKPELYRLKLAFRSASGISDARELNFGIREITYELSLFDSSGYLRRVEISPTTARERDEQVVDVTHEGMRQIPHGWAASLAPGAEDSPAVKGVPNAKDAPPLSMTDLVIKVNGVRIACRGGNWGMDDSRKRVSREHLEPFFRLYRDAHLNIIRNWVGQNTEEVFYDLADEYGQLVWNDFWATTQDYNLEPQDPALFLKNARDTILRFRNHPSIAVWCGRNEGVPQPIINEGLAKMIYTLDGTRYYSPSSNRVNLRDSGPYQYQNPVIYYAINQGFSVELGVPSMPTLESFRDWIPKADQWPISDDWAYHDWHQAGNGDVAPFMQAIETQFGAATSLEDFERKAQMLNYVEHRAIFEGFNAHLWSPNSGRLLWMTQPAWPSSSWQILSSDYDTQASYYGVKKACEPVHVQLDLSSYQVEVANTTAVPVPNASVSARVYSLENKLLFENSRTLQVSPNALTLGFKLELAPFLSSGMVFVRLVLSGESGKPISENLYWLGGEPPYRFLNQLRPATVSASASSTRDGDEVKIRVQLKNGGVSAALENKLTLESASGGARILPAYYSDNYVSLLPGETQEVQIAYPASAAQGPARLAIRGWNLSPTTIPIAAH